MATYCEKATLLNDCRNERQFLKGLISISSIWKGWLKEVNLYMISQIELVQTIRPEELVIVNHRVISAKPSILHSEPFIGLCFKFALFTVNFQVP